MQILIQLNSKQSEKLFEAIEIIENHTGYLRLEGISKQVPQEQFRC